MWACGTSREGVSDGGTWQRSGSMRTVLSAIRELCSVSHSYLCESGCGPADESGARAGRGAMFPAAQ
jgi:hypothetical protein